MKGNLIKCDTSPRAARKESECLKGEASHANFQVSEKKPIYPLALP